MPDAATKFTEAFARGEAADYRSGTAALDDPENGATWGDERTVAAAVICAALTSSAAGDQTVRRSVRLIGARITGRLRLEGAVAETLQLSRCYIEETIDLRDGQLRTLDLDGSRLIGQPDGPNGRLVALRGDRLVTTGSIRLGRGFHANGEIRIPVANIQGDLDCAGARIESPATAAIVGDGLVVGGSVILRTLVDGNSKARFRANGAVNLSRARIGRNLNCEGAALVAGTDGLALTAEDTAIDGSAFLRAQLDPGGAVVDGFEATGLLRFYRAKIKGNFDLQGASISNPGDIALLAENAVIDGTLFLRHRLFRQVVRHPFTARGTVRLYHTVVNGSVEADGGLFDAGVGKAALDAVLLEVKGVLFLRRGFRAVGEVRLSRAHVANVVDCTGATFENPGGTALIAEELVTSDSVLLRSRERDGALERFTATGAVQLYGARIGRNLDCQGGVFTHPGHIALGAEDVETGGSIIFSHTYRRPETKFTVRGTVTMYRARVNRNVNMRGAHLQEPEANQQVLNAVGLDVKGDVQLTEKFAATGGVSLDGATIGGALRYSDAKIDRLRLAHVTAGRLIDDSTSWVETELILDGFSYGGLGSGAPTTAEVRRRWCERQPGFRPQPYEQLARTLRHMGHDRDARKIAMAKQDALRRQTKGRMGWKLWHLLLKGIIGYGYEPWRALIPLTVLFVVGTVVFSAARSFDAMTPPNTERPIAPSVGNVVGTTPQDATAVSARKCTVAYPCFVPVVYALETMVPLVDLQQKKYWLPNAGRAHGKWFLRYMCIHTILGWLFTTLAVASLTGLIKKD